MMLWVVAIGGLGVIGTGSVRVHLSRRQPELRSKRCWLLGLVELLPAWLFALVSLLDRATEQPLEAWQPVAWMLSPYVALLDVILTDTAVKRLDASRRVISPCL